MSSPSATASFQADSLFAGYRAVPNLYDELRSSDGALRGHWKKLGDTLETLGPEEIASRAESARRLVREHGITYNVYSDPQGMDRLWELDVIPLVISGPDWRTIERGLIQRATLLNLILADLYGPRICFGRARYLRLWFSAIRRFYVRVTE